MRSILILSAMLIAACEPTESHQDTAGPAPEPQATETTVETYGVQVAARGVPVRDGYPLITYCYGESTERICWGCTWYTVDGLLYVQSIDPDATTGDVEVRWVE